MGKIIFSIVLIALPLLSFARTYKLEGMIGGEQPIVIELEEHYNGLFSGRYARKLDRPGFFDCDWFALHPSYEKPVEVWSISDCNLNPAGEWYGIQFSDRQNLFCKMKDGNGRTLAVVAHVTESSPESPSTISFFKEHIGDCPADMGLFSDPSIQEVFEDIMGESNFNYFAYIFQVQGPIEYNGGMFWSSGFMAHQCCDPAALWAYDRYSDNFYIWIRKDGQDYWWSQSGSVPYKFQELVSRNF